MIKEAWKEAFNELLATARINAWESAQMTMIDAFEQDEQSRIDLFSTNEDIGRMDDMIDLAVQFQGNWSYEHNIAMTPIF